MRLLLMADSLVGQKICKYLLETYPDDIALIVTTERNNITELAHKYGKLTKTYANILSGEISFSDRNTPNTYDLGILAWWPFLIKEPLINLPVNGFINTHPSYLPYNRGKHYNFWAIVEQCPFGVSLHYINQKIDSGNIVAQKEIQYGWEDNGESLYEKARKEMVKLFVDAYPKIRNGDIKQIPQDQGINSFHYAKELEAASKINLEKNYKASDLINLLRARTFPGYPGCYFYDKGQKYEINISIKKV